MMGQSQLVSILSVSTDGVDRAGKRDGGRGVEGERSGHVAIWWEAVTDGD